MFWLNDVSLTFNQMVKTSHYVTVCASRHARTVSWMRRLISDIHSQQVVRQWRVQEVTDMAKKFKIQHSFKSQYLKTIIIKCIFVIAKEQNKQKTKIHEFMNNNQVTKIHYSWWSVRGKKLLCSLVLLYILSDGSRVNRLWLGGCCHRLSFGLCADFTDVTEAP